MEGALLGQYRLTKQLGAGSYGIVYRAEHVRLSGRVAAVKLLHPLLTDIEKERTRFLQEADIMASLSDHSHIVRIDDIGETAEGVPYFVMEYLPESVRNHLGNIVDGTANLLEDPKTIPVEKAVEWTKQICDALEYAHDKNVIHRDLKPENLLLTENESIKVGDFGIAKAIDATTMTMTREGMGTVMYASPEQMNNARGATPQSDIYSLGVVLSEMLTGQPPMGFLRLPSQVNPAVPEALDTIFMKAVELQPERRWDSAGALKEALQGAVTWATDPSPKAGGTVTNPSCGLHRLGHRIREDEQERLQLEPLRRDRMNRLGEQPLDLADCRLNPLPHQLTPVGDPWVHGTT